jgi:AcrR family transcriptional regulator
VSGTRLSSGKRREAILEAAIGLFSERGFRGTTTRELAAAVGVSEPVLYQHFSTKRELYTAILEQLAEDTGTQGRPCAGMAEGDHRRYLTELANWIIDWHIHHKAHVRLLLLSALEHHEFNQLFYERYSKAFLEEVIRYFAAQMDRGVFRRMDPRVQAHTFLALVANYSLHLTVFPEKDLGVSREEMVGGFVDVLLEGVEQRERH